MRRGISALAIWSERERDEEEEEEEGDDGEKYVRKQGDSKCREDQRKEVGM
mgnify:CR=1 FL=1